MMKRETARVRIKDIEMLAETNAKLMKVSFVQPTRKGAWQQRQREVYDNGNSAAILPYDPERKTVLLARQLRVPIFLQDGLESILEACAGKLEGESAEVRIKKEMEEELGYRIAEVERLFELYVSPGTVMEKVTFFTCTYSPENKVSAGGGLADEGEDIEVIEQTLEQSMAMIGTGDIIDAKTVLLLQCLHRRTLQP